MVVFAQQVLVQGFDVVFGKLAEDGVGRHEAGAFVVGDIDFGAAVVDFPGIGAAAAQGYLIARAGND